MLEKISLNERDEPPVLPVVASVEQPASKAANTMTPPRGAARPDVWMGFVLRMPVTRGGPYSIRIVAIPRRTAQWTS